MNAKRARQLRKYAREINQPYRQVKKTYTAMSRPEREKFLQHFKDQ